jgi:predicted ATPase with chaperone activity
MSRRAQGLDNRARPDARWMLCERPCVVSGGELTLEMLDLSFDGRAGYYEAPPHFKANNGLFIVDDLGRQVITPRELMNRWVVPMERRHDHLMLRNGAKFTIPFDMVLVFSSNLRPAQLEDAAFLRRLGHKIAIDPLLPNEYAQVFERACQAEGIAHDQHAFQRLLRNYHAAVGAAPCSRAIRAT